MNEGTPQALKNAANDGYLYEDERHQMRRQATESPFNSPFQLHGGRSRLANTMVEERPPFNNGQEATMSHQNAPVESQVVPALDTQAHDLVAMLECQAYALEDIMKQKKQLAQQVRQSTAKK